MYLGNDLAAAEAAAGPGTHLEQSYERGECERRAAITVGYLRRGLTPPSRPSGRKPDPRNEAD